MVKTHLLARAVIQDSGQVLVVQARGFAHTFLPGGHIEPGEGMQAALARELQEELGVSVSIGSFLGVIEFSYTDKKGQQHYEVNLLFEAQSEMLRVGQPVLTKETHLTFDWVALADLDARQLEPAAIRNFIRERPAGAWFASVTE